MRRKRHEPVAPWDDETVIAIHYHFAAERAVREAYDLDFHWRSMSPHQKAVERLARWLRWRDGRLAEIAAEGNDDAEQD